MNIKNDSNFRISLKVISKITLVFTVLVYFYTCPIVLAETEITINSGSGLPFISPDGTGFYNDLVTELFSRLHIKAKVLSLPSSRSMINADQGVDDGVIARIKGMEKKYKNIIRVPGKILTFNFVAYSLQKKIPITGWNSLKPYSIGIIRGWRIYEKNVKGTKKLTTVSNATQLFNLLLNKRSDLILFEKYRGRWWNNQLNAKAHIIGNPIAKKDMFLYMNKKHIRLIPKIAEMLSNLKQDGTFQKLKNNTLNNANR